MSAHKTPERVLLRVKQVVEDCLRAGYAPPDLPAKGRGAHSAAVLRLMDEFNTKESTAWHWIARACQEDAFRPDYDLYRPFTYQTFKDNGLVNPAPLMPDKLGQRVGVIGDMHDAPSLPDKSRFYWIGQWVFENDFDQVVQIGDIASLDSLTRHADPGTKTFADLPSFKQDLDSLRQALSAFERGLGGKKIKKIITLGNHENRADRYEERNPQMTNLVHNALVMLLEEFDWTVIPFGEWYMVEGVALTHHVLNVNNRAFGGKTADQRTANEAVCSIIHGHTHQRQFYSAAKVGPFGSVEIISVGCALPWGVVENYAKHGPSGWWWGVSDFHLVQGQVASSNFTSMMDLEKWYSGVSC